MANTSWLLMYWFRARARFQTILGPNTREVKDFSRAAAQRRKNFHPSFWARFLSLHRTQRMLHVKNAFAGTAAPETGLSALIELFNNFSY
jgi:hypothetical protein